MNIDTIFTVKNEHLNQLDQNTAVDFFRRLLWAEARKLGIELSKIRVSSWGNVADGGVDATIDDAEITNGSEIIKQGKTCYQIKSGATFKPWQSAQIKNELFKGNSGRQNLGESIRACLDADGTYVLVCTGIDPVEPQRQKILSNIEEYLKQCDYPHPKVEVFAQNTLRGFLGAFPSLALSINGNDRAIFQTHQSWLEDATMRVSFVPGESQDDQISEIQEKLRQNNDTIHLRVLGEPGIGKTKLVLETTREEDLAPLVIYCTASQFRDSVLMNEILRDDNSFSAILIIDECNQDSRSYIWNKLKYRESRIKLITIHHHYEERSGGIDYYDAPPLDNEQICSIVQDYITIPDAEANRWAELCSGSPRVAHVIGENLRNHPEDLLKPPGTVDIWERYIVAGDDPNSEQVEQRRLVLQHLALFKGFGYELSVASEAKAIAQKIKIADDRITWDKFQSIIHQLRERKILQGDFTLYITPKALHIKLWTQWWEIRHTTFNLETFIQDLEPELVECFYDMFVYAAESEVALRVVKELLGPNGPFRDDEYLKTRLGSRFFIALTEADPESALRCLMRTIGTWDKETLLEFTDGRRSVIWALEKIAIWRKLFPDAARLLLALGEAENERISNNASGVFAELFSLGPGAVAPTEASPVERLPVLKEAFESGSKERRTLALKACRKGLISDHFSRMSGAEYQGLRKEPDLWQPKTYPEWREAYRSLWQLLSEQLERLPEDERKETVGILLGYAGSLGRIPDLGDMVVNTVKAIVANKYASEKQIIETISQILFHDDSYVENKGLPAEIRQSFEQIRDDLIGSDFHSLMQRYVGMDLIEDELLEHKDGVDRIQPHLETLARQSMDNPAFLDSELSWLVTNKAENGNRFGYELGKIDENLSLLPVLLDAQRNAGENAGTYFLGGYFHAIFDTDLALWEQQLDILCEDIILKAIIPSLTYPSGLTDRAGLRILNLAENGTININDFGLFIYQNAITNLSAGVFNAWIEFLLNSIDRSAVDLALKLFYNYYISRNSELTLPCEPAFQLLSHPELFKESDSYRYDTMTDFYWTETGKKLLDLHPRKALELVQLMLIPFGSDRTIFDAFSQSCSFLTEATRRYPAEVWKYVSEYLGSQDNFSRTMSIGRWLREADLSETEKEKGTLTLIPREKIWEWVDRDIENRAWYLASEFIPKTLLIEEWHDSLARDILVRYGDREDVRNTLISNYSTEGFWGPASLHYEEKLQKLVDIQNSDNDKGVNRWIDEYILFLEEQIEDANIREERMF
ncbi:MAG: hypothetical protein OXU51_11255 [Candidatus Poribacteria bacterium]|nr:hypothetical protein [Candidatus Poribacteria bacterium]